MTTRTDDRIKLTFPAEMDDLKSRMQEMSRKLKAVLEEAGVSIDQ